MVKLLKNDLLKICKHRRPYVFPDSAEVEFGQLGVLKVSLKKGDGLFLGHFPGDPILPGIYMQELVSQAAAISLMADPDLDVDNVLVRKVLWAEFFGMVRPECDLVARAEIKSFKRGVAVAEGGIVCRDSGGERTVCRAAFQLFVPTMIISPGKMEGLT